MSRKKQNETKTKNTNIQVENPYPNPDSFTGSLNLSKLQFFFFLWKFEINLTPGNGFRMGGVSDSWLLVVVDDCFSFGGEGKSEKVLKVDIQVHLQFQTTGLSCLNC